MCYQFIRNFCWSLWLSILYLYIIRCSTVPAYIVEHLILLKLFVISCCHITGTRHHPEAASCNFETKCGFVFLHRRLLHFAVLDKLFKRCVQMRCGTRQMVNHLQHIYIYIGIYNRSICLLYLCRQNYEQRRTRKRCPMLFIQYFDSFDSV